ncbi:TPA: hypothetical protein ACHVE4_000222 [Streptococcus suis]
MAALLQADVINNPTVDGVYWYLGQGLDQIIFMARYQQGDLQVQVNLKDFDFALHLDAVEAWKMPLSQGYKQVFWKTSRATLLFLKSVDKRAIP